MRRALPALLLTPPASAAAPPRDAWAPVRTLLDQWAGIPDLYLIVGNRSGAVFEHSKGGVAAATPMEIYSASKWFVGVAVLGAVRDGHLRLDDPVYRHLPYWASDPADPRSRVTLRSLLSFTSGYTTSNQTLPIECRADPAGAALAACAEWGYRSQTHDAEPGAVFSYNSLHLTFAGAVAAAATKRSLADLVAAYVLQPSGGMRGTRWTETQYGIAGSVESTGADYAAFLHQYAGGRLLPARLMREMEADPYPAAAGRTGWWPGEWHYSLANWYECPPGVDSWGPECAAARVHSSTGVGGFYPVVDRARGYYFALAQRSGSQQSFAIRGSLKPLLDAAMAC